MSLPLYDRVRSADPYVRLYALIEIAGLREKAAFSEELVKLLRDLKLALEANIESPGSNFLANALSLDRVNELLARYDNVNL